jgi:arsenate reductase-like glutaredoxin family protein
LKEALALAKKASTIIAAKGSKITTLDLKKDKPSDEDIAALIMGPTGNLRAPTLLAGNTLYVGFNEEAYKKLCS